ncbi:MAG: NAD(P)H-hydrate dehydratase, partial [Rhodoferax sp.]
EGDFEQCVRAINICNRPIISVDIPSGLNADTGESMGICVKATHTLCMLGLKFGLLSGHGRDCSGTVWLSALGIDRTPLATARTNAPQPSNNRLHKSHKGTYGDVAVVGGAPGMQGAAVLAATAAVYAGAGRTFLLPLSPEASQIFGARPEVMVRELGSIPIDSMTVVAGCGGGAAIEGHLGDLIEKSKNLIVDADALNALARSPTLCNQLRRREMDATILTPHPLEAARLLNSTAAAINSDRLNAAKELVDRFQCIVVLKGSGTIIASPHELPRINLSGNARLSTGGTGDVLAGMIGSYVSKFDRPFEATC